jgi:hypothetical protein
MVSLPFMGAKPPVLACHNNLDHEEVSRKMSMKRPHQTQPYSATKYKYYILTYCAIFIKNIDLFRRKSSTCVLAKILDHRIQNSSKWLTYIVL